MSKDLVSPEAMEAFLARHPEWVAQGDSHGLTLRRRFVFSSYPRGLGFVVAAAEHAEGEGKGEGEHGHEEGHEEGVVIMAA